MLNNKIFKYLVTMIAFPLAGLIFLISFVKKIRFVRLFSSRIGHYAGNTQLLIYALQDHSNNRIKYFFYNSAYDPICNLQLYKMWKRVIPILAFPLLWDRVDAILRRLSSSYKNDVLKNTFETPEGGQDKWNYLENRPVSLWFTKSEIVQAKQLLSKLGISNNKPYVCLLMRDDNYLKTQLPNHDWSYHNYRDVNANNYKAAALYLSSQNMTVIRMGKFVKDKFDLNDSNIIDYANHALRSDFLDIYLTATCQFMISNSSGLDSVAQIFKRPLLITDFPLSELSTWYYWSLFIPKKLYNKTKNQWLTFKEIYQQRDLFADKIKLNKSWKINGYLIVDNTSEEIVNSVKEMLELMQNKISISSNELQEAFWNSFPLPLPHGIASYNSIKMRIGDTFLKDNLNLLAE